jgi:hypothetical protein
MAIILGIALTAIFVAGLAHPASARPASRWPTTDTQRLIELKGAPQRRHARRQRHGSQGQGSRRWRAVAARPFQGIIDQSYGSVAPPRAPIGPAPGMPGPQIYAPPAMLPPPQYYTTPGLQQYCATRFRNYDPTTNTRFDSHGVARSCP